MALKLSYEFLMLVGTVALTLFICYDVYKAYQRGAKWLPGNFLLFYGLSVQLLGYLDLQHVSFASKHKEHELGVLIHKQLSIDSSRIVLFVFVGYLLPGLASVAKLWSTIAALSISLSSHIAMELLAVQTSVSEKDKVIKGQSGVWLISSYYVLLSSVLGFLFLFVWAIGNGIFIRDNLSARFDLVLSGSDNNAASTWETFEFEILQSWIVARVCQPEYVLGRTAFSAGVGVVLTNCVSVFIAKVICLRSQLHVEISLFTLQCVFIAVGWFAVMYRWCSAVLYFRRAHILSIPRLKVFFILFWEKIGEMLDSYVPKSFLVRIPVAILNLILSIFPFIIFLGFYIAFTVYTYVCAFWWWSSVLVLGNKFVKRLCKVQAEPRETQEFSKYKPILKRLCWAGEEAGTLWVTNESSFKYIKNRLNYFRNWFKENGINRCGNYVERVQSVEECFPEPPQQLMEPLKSVEEYFPLLKNSFRGVIARSLLIIMKELESGQDQILSAEAQKLIRNAEIVHHTFKELIDFVSCPENVGISMDFLRTKNVEAFELRTDLGQYKAKRFADFLRRSKVESTPGVDHAFTFIKEMQDRAEEVLKLWKLLEEEPHATALDTDWGSVAEHYSMYKVCKTILDRYSSNTPNDLSHLVNVLYDLFLQVIASCLRDAPKILLSGTNRWAKEIKEDKITAAIKIAGFAGAVIDEAEKRNEALQSPTVADTAIVDVN